MLLQKNHAPDGQQSTYLKGVYMTTEPSFPTPPRQTETDPTAGDRRLSNQQKESLTTEPDAADRGIGPGVALPLV